MQHLKLYVIVVTLSTEDDNNFLGKLKSGFKRSIIWNKYRPEMINQTKTNYLNYLVGPKFNKVIDYLPYHLKMKMIEHLFQSIIHQKFK